MEIQKYTGIIADIIAAVQASGAPTDIKRIMVTEAEIQEIYDSRAFRTTIDNYYGDNTGMVLEGVTLGMDGKILYMYIGGVFIGVGPYVPTGALGAVAYDALTTTGKGTLTFNVEGDDGKPYMLSGAGTPADAFVVGKNADIEMGLAIYKLNDPTYYGDGSGVFNIELDKDESWVFALSIGSLNPGVPNITDMYDISLYLDIDPRGDVDPRKWDLMLGNNDAGKNYIWYHSGSRAVTDSTSNANLSVTQTVQAYATRIISDYIPKAVLRNNEGSPFGVFTIMLEARPKFGTADPVLVEVMASISKTGAMPPPL